MKADIKEWDPENPKKVGQAIGLDYGLDLNIFANLRILRMVSCTVIGTTP